MLTRTQIETARELIYRGNLENHLEKLARVLQYAPTEPGAPLTSAERLEIAQYARRQRPGGVVDVADSWDAINAVLAKRNTVQPTKSLVDHCAKVAEQVAEMPVDVLHYARLGLIAELAKERP